MGSAKVWDTQQQTGVSLTKYSRECKKDMADSEELISERLIKVSIAIRESSVRDNL